MNSLNSHVDGTDVDQVNESFRHSPRRRISRDRKPVPYFRPRFQHYDLHEMLAFLEHFSQDVIKEGIEQQFPGEIKCEKVQIEHPFRTKMGEPVRPTCIRLEFVSNLDEEADFPTIHVIHSATSFFNRRMLELIIGDLPDENNMVKNCISLCVEADPRLIAALLYQY